MTAPNPAWHEDDDRYLRFKMKRMSRTDTMFIGDAQINIRVETRALIGTIASYTVKLGDQRRCFSTNRRHLDAVIDDILNYISEATHV